MSKPLSLRGKFVLVVVVLTILTISLYALKLRINTAILLFFLFPILIILLGKTAELIIRTLEKISTGPLSLTAPINTILLFCYYASLSIFLALLIENSAILTLLNFRPDEWQVALISLSLAFFPRVLSYASGMERARNTLLAIFTPLTLTAAVTVFTQPATLAFNLQTLELCIIGGIIQVIFGDLALYFAGFLGVIHPIITIETVSLIDLKQLVHSQLETVQWDRVCQTLEEAKQCDRVDIIQKILDSMRAFLVESRKRGAKLARIIFVDAITKALCSEPSLEEELVPLLEDLETDQEVEVRTRLAYSYGDMSKVIPDQSLRALSELLNDTDLSVLQGIGNALVILLKSNPKAVSHALKLSLNPAYLDWLMKQSSSPLRITLDVQGLWQARHIYGPELRRFREDLIIKALKAAYMNSSEIVLTHIKKCSSDKDVRLRVLAAAMVSDEEFVQNDKRLLQMKGKLKNDKDKHVRNALNLSAFHARLRSIYD